MTSGVWKRLLAGVLFAGLLIAVPLVEARSPYNNKCARQVKQAEMNLQRAIHRHGPRSRQAAQRRRQLQTARERCGGI